MTRQVKNVDTGHVEGPFSFGLGPASKEKPSGLFETHSRHEVKPTIIILCLLQSNCCLLTKQAFQSDLSFSYSARFCPIYFNIRSLGSHSGLKPTFEPVSLFRGGNKIGKCNDPDPLLVYIVLFGLSLSGFKTCMLGEGFHTLINGGLFFSPTNVGHHNPPPFGAQCSHWHSFLPPIDVGPPPNPPPFGAQRRYWHTASCLPSFGEQREG